MKFFFSFCFFFSCIDLCIAQTYDLDVSLDIVSSRVISEGKSSFQMINFDTDLTYKFELKQENLNIEVIKTPVDFAIDRQQKAKMIFENLIIEKGQKITINIKVYSKDSIPILTRENTYIFETKRRGQWQTTFGFNFVYLVNQDTYYSENNDNGTFSVAEANNQKKFEYFPTLMFTWIPTKNLCKNEDFKFAFSGGIGYDFNTTISVFLGPSLIYNENITLSIGGAFHNQQKLSSQYNKNDILNENLTYDQLHENYIRFNPFVSISFRLDKNPFESK